MEIGKNIRKILSDKYTATRAAKVAQKPLVSATSETKVGKKSVETKVATDILKTASKKSI